MSGLLNAQWIGPPRPQLADLRDLWYARFMAKQAINTTFLVELTNYGWSVGAGDERLGLFVDATGMNDVKKRRAKSLTSRGNAARSS